MNDRTNVSLIGFSDNDIKSLAQDIINNINYVQSTRDTFDTIEFENAEKLLKDPYSIKEISIYTRRLIHFLNKSNPIIKQYIKEQ
jgi:hypothetical protein